MNKIACIAVGLCLLACVGQAQAVTYASNVTGQMYNEQGTNGNLGSKFTVKVDCALSGLGIFDYGSNGLVDVHTVGLFNFTTGAPLATVTIGPGTGAVLENGFRWVAVPAVSLTAGTTYAVVASYPAYPNGSLGGDWMGGHATIDPAFTCLGVLDFETVASLPFAMPAGDAGNYAALGMQGLFGPNLKVVPEPITMVSAFIVISGLGAYMRKRTKVVA